MASEPIERIAAEAENARTRIASTIDEIQDRLDPRRIVSEAVDRVSDSGRHFVGQAGAAMRARPLAIGVAIAAVGLAFLARGKLARATVDLGDDARDYTDYDDGFGFVETQPVAPYDEADDDDDAAGAADRARVLAAKAGDTVEANPFVSIILGLAAGAALGALFPATDAERRVLGETGGKIGNAARAAARRAADELDAAGLSVDNVRNKAGEATRKARAAAQSVVDAARDEFKA